MRMALRIISGLTILCIVAGPVLLSATNTSGGDSELPSLPLIGFFVLGSWLTLTTAVLGIIATAMRRQFAWLVAIIVVSILPLAGIAVVIPVAATLARQADPSTSAFLTNTVFPALILADPLLVGLVTLIYSFFMRDPAPVASVPYATVPRR